MARYWPFRFLSLLACLTGCTSIIFDSDAGTGTRGLLEFVRPVGSISSVVSGEGIEPDVSFDGERVAFIRRVGGIRQVFVMTLGEPATLAQLTFDPTPKSEPRWSSQGHLAFAAGSEITVLNPDLTPFVFASMPPQLDSGLDFHEDGSALVYARDNNLFIQPLDQSQPEIQITNCSVQISCSDPIVSHDQSLLAYRFTIVLGPGWPEGILIVSLPDLSSVGSISMGPAIGAGGNIHSYDFSPDDNRLYVAAKSFDAATASYIDELSLFVVDLDGSNRQLLQPDPQVRYPSTFRSGL